MRMSTDSGSDEQRSVATITAAAEAGVTVFDTAHAYSPDAAQLGHNERLLADALGSSSRAARVVTKGGMSRAGGGWLPDGRAKAILADCEASLVALDGLPIDLYLLHAPDPRTPWRTSVRALARLVDQGIVRRVGLSNVNRQQLDEACTLAPIAAVQVALNWYDDRALRGGVVERCVEAGITLIAHSPLGGPGRAGRLPRQQPLLGVAQARGVTPAEVALAWLLELAPTMVAIPGARRPESARSAARAASLALDASDRATLARVSRSGSRGVARPAPTSESDLVLVMGIPGAGKSRVAQMYVDRGYVRLNRDELGGSLRAIADALDDALSSGAQRVVLDNTYLSRAARSYVIDVAARHGAAAHCVWVDTPLDQAQFNLVERILDRVGSLPSPEELKALARREPGLLTPTSQMRALRELEAPTSDEGFASVERSTFSRESLSRRSCGGVLVAARVLASPAWEQTLAAIDPNAPHLIFDWRPNGSPEDLAASVARVAAAVPGTVEPALCPHPAGPPTCWCRPPLPGLALAFARSHNLDLSRTSLIGVSPAHRTLARTLGARHVPV
jgi:aryl-alcohol dehydrogenase-like predicted oxidoreductase/predicted kinase